VLVALALRPQLAGIGPLADWIMDDLGASHAFVGLLTTIPVLCMGLFAPLGPALAGRLGSRLAIAVAAGAIVAAGLARAVAPGEGAILALTLAIGVATAASGPILAMYVRGVMPEHRVAGTAAYASGTNLGQALAAGAVVPAAMLLGGWRASLAAVSGASALAVAAWIALTRGPRHDRPVAGARLHLPLRRPVVWVLGLLFGLQSAVFYGTNAWLPSLYIERGWTQVDAAALVAAMSLVAMAATLIAPLATRRGAERRELLAAASASVAAGIVGVIVLPGLAWAWAVALGAGLGLLFTVCLTLPTDVASDAREAGGASALMLLVGYMVASTAPFALGAARDATGSFAASLWLLLALALALLPLSWALSPERLRPHAASRGSVG